MKQQLLSANHYAPFAVSFGIGDFLSTVQVSNPASYDEFDAATDVFKDSSGDEGSCDEPDPDTDPDMTVLKLGAWLEHLARLSKRVEAYACGIYSSTGNTCPQVPSATLGEVVSGTAYQERACSSGAKRSIQQDDDAVPLSSSRRSRSPPARSAKLCQAPACVYNRNRPGQPARSEASEFCIWCDPEAMGKALEDKYKVGHIKQSLKAFQARSTEVYEASLAKLPLDFDQSTQKHPCCNPDCVYDRNGYGRPALTKRQFCVWCDEAAMAAAVKNSYERGHIKQSLSAFKAANTEVYEKACLRLPADFDSRPQKNLCQNPGCVFSLRSVGSRAREMPGSRLCAWCDPTVMATREGSMQGTKSIMAGLKKFAEKAEVLRAAWEKLSSNFQTLPERAAATVRERAAMMKEDVVRECKGRTVPYISEPAMCSFCRTNPCPISLRTAIKEFESVAAARAAAAGEARVPIEKDADWMRLLFAGARAESQGHNLIDIYTSHCGCLGWKIQARCALCLGKLGHCDNFRHYENTGGCSAQEAPPRAGFCLDSKTGLHAVALLHRAGEISAMWSNDKHVGQPELTFQQLCAQEQEWRQRRLRAEEAERTRELEAMLCEDYVLFEKVFMVVQLDPVGGCNSVLNLRAFDDLAMALEWLRAPSMQDDAIRMFGKDLAFWWRSSPSFMEGPGFLLQFSKLPSTAELRRELQARRAESPRAMMLYRRLTGTAGRWSYLDAQGRASLGPRTILAVGEWFTFWEAQPFPWVEMPPMFVNVINFLRSRAPICCQEEQRIQALAWKPSRRG